MTQDDEDERGTRLREKAVELCEAAGLHAFSTTVVGCDEGGSIREYNWETFREEAEEVLEAETPEELRAWRVRRRARELCEATGLDPDLLVYVGSDEFGSIRERNSEMFVDQAEDEIDAMGVDEPIDPKP